MSEHVSGCPRCFIENKACARHCDPATCPDPAHDTPEPEHDRRRAVSETEWLTVGAEVATLRSDWRNRAFAPTRATVTKIGKRDVVLDNGERFNVGRLQRREGGDWGWTVALLPASDPIVAQAQAAHDHDLLVGRAKVACGNFCYGKADVTAADAILALAPLTGRADEIAALLT